ncbi:MAG: helix-turn-helix transcriptional regulator [Bacteroidota bacterium]
MKKLSNILAPVKREDFLPDFSNHLLLTEKINPEEIFASAIMHFKKFSIGKYCWFIANVTNGNIEAAGGMMEQVTAIPAAEFLASKPDRLFGQMHPDDVHQMFAFTNYWIPFFMSQPEERKPYVSPTIYIRLKNVEQLYKWVSVQYANHILNTSGNIIYGLTVITDISHLKTEGPAMMSILDSLEESCQHFYCSENNNVSESGEILPKLTSREIEVLRYLAIGNSSKQIAGELNISIKTTDNHRQNMLRKTKSKSTGELVSFAIRNGFM